MTKILLVISKFYPEYTGAAHRIGAMYRRLQQGDPNLQIQVMCNSTSYMTSQDYEHEGWRIQRRVFPWRLRWCHKRLRDAMKVYYEFFSSLMCLVRHKPDIIHIAGYSGGTMAASLYARWCKIPRFIELVTKEANPFHFLPALRYKRLLALEKQTVIVAISQAIAKGCYDRGLRDMVWCRPNPVDQDKFHIETESKSSLRKQCSPFSDEDKVIAMVAKFMPQKNQIFLLDVLQKLPPDFKLILAGPRVQSGILKARDDAYFESLQSRIQSMELQERVHVHAGFVNADIYMKASDVYMMPQYEEGLGTPMLEAIACGVPVVANSAEAAFTEWIKEGESGFLCPLDANKWADAILKAADIKLEKRQREAQHILSLANAGHIDQQYQSLMSALLACEVNGTVRVADII